MHLVTLPMASLPDKVRRPLRRFLNQWLLGRRHAYRQLHAGVPTQQILDELQQGLLPDAIVAATALQAAHRLRHPQGRYLDHCRKQLNGPLPARLADEAGFLASVVPAGEGRHPALHPLPAIKLYTEAGRLWADIRLSMPGAELSWAQSVPLEIPKAWRQQLIQYFTPVVQEGRVMSRPCVAHLSWDGGKLSIDVWLPRIRQANAEPDMPEVETGTRFWDVTLPKAAAAAALIVGPALPAVAADYTVKSGDTLSSIARQHIGPAATWHAVFQANRHALHNPNRIYPGMVLHLPESTAAVPSGGLVIRPGDTLFRLAQRHLGNGAKWTQLWAANKDHLRSPNLIYAGMPLRLPGNAPVAHDPAATGMHDVYHAPAAKPGQGHTAAPKPAPKPPAAAHAPAQKPAAAHPPAAHAPAPKPAAAHPPAAHAPAPKPPAAKPAHTAHQPAPKRPAVRPISVKPPQLPSKPAARPIKPAAAPLTPTMEPTGPLMPTSLEPANAMPPANSMPANTAPPAQDPAAIAPPPQQDPAAVAPPPALDPAAIAPPPSSSQQLPTEPGMAPAPDPLAPASVTEPVAPPPAEPAPPTAPVTSGSSEIAPPPSQSLTSTAPVNQQVEKPLSTPLLQHVPQPATTKPAAKPAIRPLPQAAKPPAKPAKPPAKPATTQAKKPTPPKPAPHAGKPATVAHAPAKPPAKPAVKPPVTPPAKPVAPVAAQPPVVTPVDVEPIPPMLTELPTPAAPNPEPASASESVSQAVPTVAPEQPSGIPTGTGQLRPPTMARAFAPPFSTHLSLLYNPLSYKEDLATQDLQAAGSITQAVGAEAGWRLADPVELAGSYVYNSYRLDREGGEASTRSENHGRLMGYYVLPLSQNLELGFGAGAQLSTYATSGAAPAEGRTADLFDASYQRVMVQTEAKVGYQPVRDLPLTLSAGAGVMPWGTVMQSEQMLPTSLWGFSYTAGVRYSIMGVALEARYMGQQILGDKYQQGNDMLRLGLGYEFR